ncbi:MAG TPA: terminase [Blastocatellia bacterium]|nr:terminase [Blastocatellia bacterium]
MAATGTATNYAVQPGPQTLLVGCPVPDVLFGGARGGGKTWGLLFDWLSHRIRAGKFARGILFRRTLPELDEVKDRARQLFPLTGGEWMASKNQWNWRDGSFLRLRYLDRDSDADSYQGHAYTWMGVDEAGSFPSPKPIDLLRACLRSGDAPVPKVFRATGNPGGVGHNWLKARYIDPAPPLTPFQDSESGGWRVFIPSSLEDNPALRLNDPDYERRIRAATNGNDALWKAWRYGDWDIVAGGMFDDLWKRSVHVIEPFRIPFSWYVDRSFDWGSSRPFACLWWAESDGTQAGNGRHYPRGTLFLIHEYYGWNGKPDTGLRMGAKEVAREILKIEQAADWIVKPGPADSAIYDVQNPASPSIGDEMASAGVKWTEADKSPGSRINGAEKLRGLLRAALQWPMEEPGIFVFNHCTQFIRTVPVLPRDQKRIDDVDTRAEDHIYDAVRYRVMKPAARKASRLDLQI